MSIKFEHVEVDSVILCDDVRKEDNGKMIAIGIYGGNITVNSFPAAFGLSLLFRVRTTKAGSTPLDVRVKYGSKSTIKIHGEVFTDNGDWALMATPHFAVTANEPGVIEVAFGDRTTDDWVTALVMPVAKSPTTA